MEALHDRRCVSEAAGEVLERLGKRVPHALVLQALGDPMPHVRRIAIHLSQAIDYKEAFPVETIRGMIQDREASVREVAILALNQLGAIESAEPFIAALNDNENDVRKAALLAVAKLGERAPLEPLKSLLGESEIYKNVIVCLQQTHPKVLREVAEEASNILRGKGAGQVLGSLIQEHVAEVIGKHAQSGASAGEQTVRLAGLAIWERKQKSRAGTAQTGKRAGTTSRVRSFRFLLEDYSLYAFCRRCSTRVETGFQPNGEEGVCRMRILHTPSSPFG